jgi:hypothetical protein
LKPGGLQFDPVSGQGIGSAAMSYASSSYHSVSSGYIMLRKKQMQEKQIKPKKI